MIKNAFDKLENGLEEVKKEIKEIKDEIKTNKLSKFPDEVVLFLFYL